MVKFILKRKKVLILLAALSLLLLIKYLQVWLLILKESHHCKCMYKDLGQIDEYKPYIFYYQTTCGRKAWSRGSGQKVIAFSFYESPNILTSKGYFKGILGNIRLLPKYYPGWYMRVYHDIDARNSIYQDLCDLACAYPNLDFCDINNLPGTPVKNASKIFAMNWRFFPTLDPQVDIYASRDLDSRFSSREKAAVDQWLSSNKTIHSMRDHPLHNAPLLGASWGSDMRQKGARQNWKISWRNIFGDLDTYRRKSSKGPDQAILEDHVWTWAQNDSIQHDSYLCEFFEGTVPWPTRRERKPNNFVASVVSENIILWKDCPEKCRKKKYWVKC